jgi:fatty acid desaturase
MLPRNAADYKSLLWVFVLAPGVAAVQYANPGLIKYMWWVSLYFAIATGTIAHNHNHNPTFTNKRANSFFANWISLIYGFPTFAWIPTHNLNHHKFVNTEGDATITWRFTNSHNVFVAATYFFVSSYYQQFPTKAFIDKAKAGNPALYRRIIGQYVFWGTGYVLLLALALAIHGLATGLFVFTFVVAIPAVFSLWTIMLFNYEQHVHTDPWSKHDHSRSFVSPTLNFLLFNNGYHAAHHENPSMHWSQLKEAHFKIADKINPVLNQTSVWWYWFRQYAIVPFVPSLGTVQLGAGPMNPPDGARIQGAGSGGPVKSADVDLGDAGTNAERIQVSQAAPAE